MKLSGYFAWALILLIATATVCTSVAAFAQAQRQLRLYARPQGSDPGIPVATLRQGVRADRGDQSRYAGDAFCARMLADVAGGVVQVFARPSLKAPFEDRGTGFFCSAGGRVAACEHELVDCASGLRVFTADHRMFTVDIVKHDKKNDIGILQVRNGMAGPFPALTLGSSRTLAHQQDLIAFGYPQTWNSLFMSPGQFLCCQASGPVHDSQGVVLTYMDPARMMIKLRMHCEPGNSGSPVFDVNERVAGIVEAVDTDSYEYTYVTPVEDLVSDLH